MIKKSILFVDDDANLLNSLKRVLRQYTDDWIMVFVESGREALKALEKQKFDIIFADYKMPEMDGIELLNTIKDRYPNIKRVLLTGQSETEIYKTAESIVHKYISKPCDYSLIISVIKEL